MRHGNLSREQVIEAVGLAAVERAEATNCEPTSRVQTDGDTDVECASSVTLPGGRVLTAYYYLTPEEAQYEDGADVDWQIHGYELA